MKMYRVYDKNPTEPNALDICHCFTEQGAQAEVGRQAKKSREAAYDTFTPRCTWGSCTDAPCQDEATWFDTKMDTYGAVCDGHYHPEWMSRKVRWEEKVSKELGNYTPDFNREQLFHKTKKAGQDQAMANLGPAVAPRLPGL